MSPKRLYFGLIAAIFGLFIALLAGTYGINSLLSSRANTLTQLKAKSEALNQEQLGLANAKEEVSKYSSLQQIAQSIVPEDKDQAEAVRQIVKIAGANGISLASVTFPASTLGNGPGGSSSATSSASSGSSATASPPPTASNPNVGKLSQLQAVKNIPGVYILQLTVQSDPNDPVSYTSFINFLNDLEHNRRTAQISSINLEPDTENPNLLTFTLVLNEYIKP